MTRGVLPDGVRGALLAFCLLVAPHTLGAQQPTVGRLEGVVRDPLSGSHRSEAVVELSRVDSEPVLTFRASPDDRGRFHFDSLPPGEYAVHLSTPLLDSLELSLPERATRVAPGRTTHEDFAIPRGAALRDAVCPGLALGPGKGVVAGRAIDADTDRPLAAASVVVTWAELVVDDATLKTSNQDRTAAVQTGPRGDFRLCGVPTGTRLTLQLQYAGRIGSDVVVTVSDEQGAVAHDLSLSALNAPTIAALDSADRAGTTTSAVDGDELLLTGTAILAGTVLGPTGLPLPNTELRVRNARSSAVSDAAGRFTIAALPAGTQTLLVRHIGYEITELPIELRAGRTLRRDVRLARAISLDSVRVVALRSQYPEFDYNRRANPFGRYLGPDDVARRKPTEPTDLLVGVPGITVVGHGHDAIVASTRHRTGAHGCAGVNVIVDGAEGVPLNDIPASQVAAVEIYADGAFAPARFAIRNSCGVVVVWTKASRRIPTAKPAGANAEP